MPQTRGLAQQTFQLAGRAVSAGKRTLSRPSSLLPRRGGLARPSRPRNAARVLPRVASVSSRRLRISMTSSGSTEPVPRPEPAAAADFGGHRPFGAGSSDSRATAGYSPSSRFRTPDAEARTRRFGSSPSAGRKHAPFDGSGGIRGGS